MKKFIAIIIGLAVIIGIIFAVKSCSPRTKPLTESEEITAFVKANTDFSCLLKNSPDLKTNDAEAKTELNNIYAKYRFPTENDQAMMDILNKYSTNADVINQIKAGTKNC